MSGGHESEYREETLKYHRRVFSWLVVVQAAILLATSADPDVTLNRAIYQISAIERFTQSWDDKWAHTAAKTRLAEVQAEHANYWPRIFVSGTPFQITVLGEPPIPNAGNIFHATFYGGSSSLRGPNGIRVPDQGPGAQLPVFYPSVFTLEEPTSLKKFQEIWDSLNRETRIALAARPTSATPARIRVWEGANLNSYLTRIELVEDTSPPQILQYRLNLREASGEAIADLTERFQPPRSVRGQHNLDLIPPSAQLMQTVLLTNFSRSGLPPTDTQFTIEIAIPTYEVPIEMQKLLRDSIATDITLGSFENAFSELQAQSAGMEALPIADLRALLIERRRSVNRNIQLLGLSFPIGSLSIWGTGFLLLLQFYFLVGLRALEPSVTTADRTFPWIAFFNDPLARGSFASLSFFTPVGIITFVGYPIFRAGWSNGQFLLIGAILAASICFAILSSLIYVKLLKKLS